MPAELMAFVPRERDAHETRVAATPETVRRLRSLGLAVLVEAGAGRDAHIADAAYEDAGAERVDEAAAGLQRADLVLKVSPPTADEVAACRPGAAVVSFLFPGVDDAVIEAMEARGLRALSMNSVPRISRAQRMDALSSQANISGYKAAVLAAATLPRYFPLLMTAAGTIKPAIVVVMGAGVAGMQAIATSRRLGADVWATDVRLAVREQVQSLGARFIDVPGMEDMEDDEGYAREATAEFLARQREVVGDKIAGADVVITTARVAGGKAPLLVPRALVERMRSGSVIVDLAAGQGGNCELSEPGETVEREGVTIIGARDLACSVPDHASELYARNVLAFVEPLVEGGALRLDGEDEIVAAALLTGRPDAADADADADEADADEAPSDPEETSS